MLASSEDMHGGKMSKKFSEWLSNQEPVLRLLYRLAIVVALAVGVNNLSNIEQDFGAISDGIAALQDELANIRSGLEDQQDDSTSTSVGTAGNNRL